MSARAIEEAAAASDAYADRSQQDVDTQKEALLAGRQYVVVGYTSDSATGFHATAYQNVVTRDIIIAFRGTDPDFLHHTAVTLKDAGVDFEMVRDGVNRQEPAAHAFTEAMIAKAARHGISHEHITLSGHSLGGTLVQIEAAKYGLQGATFNAYGAVDLGYGVSEGGARVKNYRMAGDVPSAASHHFGEVISLASDADVGALKAGRYIDAAPGALPRNPVLAVRLTDHDMGNFAPEAGSGRRSVLEPGVREHYAQNYTDHKAAFDALRGDVYDERVAFTEALRQDSSRDLTTLWANLPPRIREQVAEWHALHVDTPIAARVEHAPVFTSFERALEGTGAAVRGVAQTVQALDEQAATHLRRASGYVGPVSPTTMLTGMLLAEAAHLHGTTADAGSKFLYDGTAAVRHRVEQVAHLGGRITTTVSHVYEQAAVAVADRGIEAWRDAKAAAQVMRMAATPGVLGPGDPRIVGASSQALYRQLQARIADVDDHRLLHCTVACRANGMTDENLGQIYHDRRGGTMTFLSTSPLVPPATVDLKMPPPDPRQSVERLQQIDRDRQVQTQAHAEMQARNAQAQQELASGLR